MRDVLSAADAYELEAKSLRCSLIEQQLATARAELAATSERIKRRYKINANDSVNLAQRLIIRANPEVPK